MKPTRARLASLSAAFAAALLLGGCSVLGGGKQNDPITIYSPQVSVPVDPSWPTVRWQLAIVDPSAPRVVDSTRIAVRPVAGELQVYKRAGWAQPSSDMLEAVLLHGFEDSGRIAAVARAGTGIRQDYKLVTDVRRFESEYAGAATPSALIEVNAKLVHTVDQRIVASRTFLQREAAGSEEVDAVVAAFERGLAKLGGEVVGWTLVSGEADARTKR